MFPQDPMDHCLPIASVKDTFFYYLHLIERPTPVYRCDAKSLYIMTAA